MPLGTTANDPKNVYQDEVCRFSIRRARFFAASCKRRQPSSSKQRNRDRVVRVSKLRRQHPLLSSMSPALKLPIPSITVPSAAGVYSDLPAHIIAKCGGILIINYRPWALLQSRRRTCPDICFRSCASPSPASIVIPRFVVLPEPRSSMSGRSEAKPRTTNKTAVNVGDIEKMPFSNS